MLIVTSCGWLSRRPAPVMRTNRLSVFSASIVGGTAVTHRLTEPSDELVDDRRDRPLVEHAPLDPLRDELVDVLDVALEVAILRERPGLHRAERSHAAVLLEALALDEDHVAGRLVGAGKHRAEHHRVGASGDRLRNVTRGGDAAVGDHRDAVPNRDLGDVEHGRHLGDADAGDDAGGADRSRPNSCL